MNSITPDIQDILNRLADGISSEEDEKRLGEWLRSGPQARKHFRDFMALHSELHWDYVLASKPEEFSVPEVTEVSSPLPLFGWFTTFATGAVLAAFIVWAVLNSPDPADIKETPDISKGSVTALLLDEANAEFADGRSPDGVRFEPGEYELVKGMTHLRFSNGADMVLVAPALLQIEDTQHTRLVYGKVRVTAPPSAKGFTVSTGSANYIDLGTEFGLQVDKDSGASDLYVFDGQVIVEDPNSGKVLSEINGGESSRVVDGAIANAPEITENKFPTSGSIGLRRWQQSEEKIRQDRGLLAFYPFHKLDDESVLANAISNTVMEDGNIVGARWTTGRWTGKHALLFDSDNDFVGIKIPGEYPELTLAAWIRVDRFDFVFNAILNSDGYDLGDIHFQLTRQGYPRGGVIVEGKFRDEVLSQPVPLGEWVHVASVLNTQTRTQQIYVNAQLSRERFWQSDEPLRPGSCRLGNWLSVPGVGSEKRAFRGSIDELAIWKRALSEADINHLFEAGRPGMTLGMK